MKRNLLLLFFLVAFIIPSFSQTNSAKKVILEVNKLKSSVPLQDVVSYLEDRETSFDFNDIIDKFIYNLQMGAMNFELGRYNKAYPYLLTTTQICDDESEVVFCPQNEFLVTYYWLAVSALNIGESQEKVLAKLNRAKKVFELSKLTGTPLYQTMLNDIKVVQSDYSILVRNASQALVLALQGKYKEAIPQLEKVISDFPESKGFLEKSKFIQLLTTCYVYTDQLKEAEDLYVSTITELEHLKAENNEVYWNLCDGLATVYIQLHNYEKAKHYASTSKRLHEQYLNFGDGYTRCLSNCATIEKGLGHNALAKIFMDVALRQMHTNYIGFNYKNINDLLFVQDDIHQIKNFQSSIEKNFKIKPLILSLSNAAAIYSDLGYRGEAISCIKESVVLAQQIGEVNSLVINNLGALYLEEDKLEEADSCFNQAYKFTQSFFEIEGIGLNLALTKYLLNKNDSPAFATKFSKQIKDIISHNFSFLTEFGREDYWAYLEVCFPILNLIMYEENSIKSMQAIYDNVLFEKGLLLRSSNSLRDAILSSDNKILIEKFNQLLVYQQQLIKEKNKSQQVILKNRIELVNKDLINHIQTYDLFHYHCTWKDVQKKLSNNEIAIEFYNIPSIKKSKHIQNIEGEPRICALILKAGYNSPHIVPLCQESVVEGKNSDKLKDLHDLYNIIWKPLANELQGVKRIYFSPYRSLHTVPIEYLVDQNGLPINEKYEIFRLSSTRIIAEKINHPKKYKNVSLYGGLLYDLTYKEFIAASTTANHKKQQANRVSNVDELRYGVKYLPGTNFEVNTIFGLFKKHKITPTLYCGLDGTEEAFKNMSGIPLDILHISTHGFYWSDEEIETKSDIPFLKNTPIRNKSMCHTGLFMTGANIALKGLDMPYDIDDGILTSQEISSLNLDNVDLVVLSACQTGLGDIYNDAVYGLQRGFKLAGANSMLVSLWKVNDKVTMILMTEFYKQLLKGKTKVESLKLAQKFVQNKYGIDHPEYWAGFILLDALY